MTEVLEAAKLTKARIAELNLLPSEHQNYYISDKRFLVHNAELQGRFGKQEFDDVKFPSEAAPPLTFYMMSTGTVMTEEIRGRLIAQGLLEFYSKNYTADECPDYSLLFESFLTMLGTYLDPSFVGGSGLRTCLLSYHRTLNVGYYDDINVLKSKTQPAVDYFMELFKAKYQSDLFKWVVVVALTIFITIGKIITDNNRKGWFHNRWNAIAPTVGVKFPKNDIIVPELGACSGFYTFMTSHSLARTIIFKIYRTLGGQKDNSFSGYFEKIINLLQWSEMSHMWLITTHVMDHNKEVLAYPELFGPEVSPMIQAINFMKGFPADDRAFLKLLYSHEETKPIHSKGFPFFSAASKAIASIDNPSMKHLTLNKSSEMAAFAEKVKEFVLAKRKVGPTAAGVAFASGKHDMVKKQILSLTDGMSRDVVDQLGEFHEVAD